MAGITPCKQREALDMIPPFTGSRLPGRWVEIDDSGSRASVLNGVRISGEELQRTGQTFQRGVDTDQ